MKDKIKQAISTLWSTLKHVWPGMRSFCVRSYGVCKIICRAISDACVWLYERIADLFRKVPSELTYWQDGILTTAHVDDFVEIAPNLIQYEDSVTGKRVKVKAEYPIKYILKEK